MSTARIVILLLTFLAVSVSGLVYFPIEDCITHGRNIFVRSYRNSGVHQNGTTTAPFLRIQDAIDMVQKTNKSKAEDCIFVSEGTYYEDLTFDRSVKIFGCAVNFPRTLAECVPTQGLEPVKSVFLRSDNMVTTTPNISVTFAFMKLSFDNFTSQFGIHSFELSFCLLVCYDRCSVMFSGPITGSFSVGDTKIFGHFEVSDLGCFEQQQKDLAPESPRSLLLTGGGYLPPSNHSSSSAPSSSAPSLMGRAHFLRVNATSMAEIEETSRHLNITRRKRSASSYDNQSDPKPLTGNINNDVNGPMVHLIFRTVRTFFARDCFFYAARFSVHRVGHIEKQPLLILQRVATKVLPGLPFPSVVIRGNNVTVRECSFDQTSVYVKAPDLDPDVMTYEHPWIWAITNNSFSNSTLRFVNPPPRLSPSYFARGASSNIVVAYNRFSGNMTVDAMNNWQDLSNEVVVLDMATKNGIFVDGRRNWFGSAYGPSSCCNTHPVCGVGVSFGVDFSAWCTAPDCAHDFSLDDVSSACAHVRRCSAFEDYLWSIPIAVNSAIVLVAALIGRLVWVKAKTTEKRMKRVLTTLYACVGACSVVGLSVALVFLTRYMCNNRIICANKSVASLFFALFIIVFACGFIGSVWAYYCFQRNFLSLRWLFIFVLLSCAIGVIVVPTGIVSAVSVIDWNADGNDFGNSTAYVAAPKLAMPREILFGFGATVPTSFLLVGAALFTWYFVKRRHFAEVASAQDELESMVKRVGVSGGLRGNKLIAKPSYRLVVGLVTQLLTSLMYLALVVAFATNMAEQSVGNNPTEAADEKSLTSNAIAELSTTGIPFGMFASVTAHMTVSVLFIFGAAFGIAVLRFSFWRPALLYVYSVVGILTAAVYLLPVILSASLIQRVLDVATRTDSDLSSIVAASAAKGLVSRFGWQALAIMVAGSASALMQIILSISVSMLRNFTSKKLPVVIVSNIDRSMRQILEAD